MATSVSGCEAVGDTRRDEHAEVVLAAQLERQRGAVGGAAFAQVVQHDAGRADRHVPVVGLVQVVVQPDQRPLLAVARLPCTISRPAGNHARRYVSMNRPRSSPCSSGSTT